MPQDDVTDSKPLRGGRQKANHIQVHRFEMGLWERKNIAEPLADSIKQFNEVRKFATVAVPLVAAGGVYVAYRIGQSAYGWVGENEEAIKKWWENFVYGNDEKFFFWDKDGNFSL
jgi:hypothetical protein